MSIVLILLGIVLKFGGEATKSDVERLGEIFSKDLNVVVYHLEAIDKELNKEKTKKENIQHHAERLTEYINTELQTKVQAFNLPIEQKQIQEKVGDVLEMIKESVKEFKNNIITEDSIAKYESQVQVAMFQLGNIMSL